MSDHKKVITDINIKVKSKSVPGKIYIYNNRSQYECNQPTSTFQFWFVRHIFICEKDTNCWFSASAFLLLSSIIFPFEHQERYIFTTTEANMNVINQHLDKENIVFTNNSKTNSIQESCEVLAINKI
jgi:hypothetical protein